MKPRTKNRFAKSILARILAVIMILSLVITLVPISTFAATGSVGTVGSAVGSTIVSTVNPTAGINTTRSANLKIKFHGWSATVPATVQNGTMYIDAVIAKNIVFDLTVAPFSSGKAKLSSKTFSKDYTVDCLVDPNFVVVGQLLEAIALEISAKIDWKTADPNGTSEVVLTLKNSIPATVTVKVIKGDGNGDGKVDLADGILLMQYLNNFYPPPLTPTQLFSFDMDENGVIDDYDLDLVAKTMDKVLPLLIVTITIGLCDVNLDGWIDILDVSYLNKYLEGKYPGIFTPKMAIAADADRNGKLDWRDANITWWRMRGIH